LTLFTLATAYDQRSPLSFIAFKSMSLSDVNETFLPSPSRDEIPIPLKVFLKVSFALTSTMYSYPSGSSEITGEVLSESSCLLSCDKVGTVLGLAPLLTGFGIMFWLRLRGLSYLGLRLFLLKSQKSGPRKSCRLRISWSFWPTSVLTKYDFPSGPVSMLINLHSVRYWTQSLRICSFPAMRKKSIRFARPEPSSILFKYWRILLETPGREGWSNLSA
jgi:hypothetical protein